MLKILHYLIKFDIYFNIFKIILTTFRWVEKLAHYVFDLFFKYQDSLCEDLFFVLHNFLGETSNVCKLGGAFLAHKCFWEYCTIPTILLLPSKVIFSFHFFFGRELMNGWQKIGEKIYIIKNRASLFSSSKNG